MQVASRLETDLQEAAATMQNHKGAGASTASIAGQKRPAEYVEGSNAQLQAYKRIKLEV